MSEASPALTEADQAMREPFIPTPEMIAAAWKTWLERQPNPKLGPGPAFREALEAAFAKMPDDLRARATAAEATLREREAEIERLRTALNKIAGNAGYGRQTYAADGSETGQSLSRCWGIVEDFARAALAQPDRLPETATGGETA
jgi:hypothetical protein